MKKGMKILSKLPRLFCYVTHNHMCRKILVNPNHNSLDYLWHSKLTKVLLGFPSKTQSKKPRSDTNQTRLSLTLQCPLMVCKTVKLIKRSFQTPNSFHLPQSTS